MRKALLSLALLAGSFVARTQTLPGLILNEVSQGPNVGSGQKEYFEFVVAGTPTCTGNTLDLRGWIFDDNNNWVAAGSGTGIATGAMRFANVANWAAVPYGAIILVYNDNDKNGAITLPNDPTDANNDLVYVLPASSTMFDRNTVAPTTTSGSNFVYPTTNWVSGGDWSTVALRNAGDAVIIVKPTVRNTEYFSLGFAIGSASSATVWVPNMDSDSNRYLSDGNYNQASSWLLGVATGVPATGSETPGAPNGGANTAWINSMRTPATGLTVNPVSSSNGSTLCVGSNTTLSSTTSGGTWTSATPGVVSVNGTTGVATAVAAGGPVTITYTVTSGGCTGTATYTITVVAAANAGTVSGGPAVCAGSTVTYTSTGTPGGTWSSSNPAIASVDPSTGVVTGVAAGGPVNIIYTVGSGACAATASAPITVNAKPVVQPTTGNSSICNSPGASVMLTNPAPDGSGTWSSTDPGVATVVPTTPGASTANVSPVSAGTTTINFTVTSNGCTTVMPFTFTVNPRPAVAAIGGPATVCSGSTITLTNATPGGAWTSVDPSIATVNGTTGVVTGVSAGTAQIQYIVTSGSCSNAATTNITVTAPPALQPTTGASSLCVGGNTQLTNPLQPNGAGTWAATPSGLVTLTPTTVTGGPNVVDVTALAAGTVTINFTAGSAGCSSTMPFTLTIDPLPVVGPVLGASNLCSGATVTVTNATPGGVWSSSNPAAATVDPATGVVTGVATGTADIIYTVTTAAGCAGSNRATINVTSTPAPGPITGNTTLCVGATSTLQNSLAGGTWSSGNAALASVNATTGVVTGIAPGTNIPITYTVTNNGCTGTANTTVTVNAAPVLAPIAAQTLCAGGTATLTPSIAGGTWTSSNPAVATISNAGLLTAVAAGNTQLTYTVNNGGCTATQIVNVTVNSAAVQLNASATSINAGQSVTLTPAWTGTAPFTVTGWTPPALLPNQTAATQTLAPAATTTFSVSGTDANGCAASGSVTVTVTVPVTDDLFVPNYFTPNNDGRNDVLYFYGSSVTALEFRIFNQWGEQVFVSTDKSRGWDGSAAGKQQPVGVYMYVAKATLANGQTRTLKGSINLIR